MRHEDVKIGMKVVPHNKSTGIAWNYWKSLTNDNNESSIPSFFNKNGFLYVVNINDDGEIILNCSQQVYHGDHFRASDFKLYVEEGEKKIKMDFSKSDLKTGMIVTTRDGVKCMVMLNNIDEEDKLISLEDGCYLKLSLYNSMRFNGYDDTEFDIMKIEQFNDLTDTFCTLLGIESPYIQLNSKTIWERIEKSKEQIELEEKIKNLQREVMDQQQEITNKRQELNILHDELQKITN